MASIPAILWRDLFVTGKEFWVFLVQVALQPLFMLFVFARVLGAGGYVTDDYAHLLLPGFVALTAFLNGRHLRFGHRYDTVSYRI